MRSHKLMRFTALTSGAINRSRNIQSKPITEQKALKPCLGSMLPHIAYDYNMHLE